MPQPDRKQAGLSRGPEEGQVPIQTLPEQDMPRLPQDAAAGADADHPAPAAEPNAQPAELNARPAASQPGSRKDILYEILDTVRLMLIVLVIGLLLMHYVVQRNTVQGLSMFPTLFDHDELVVEKVSRYFGKIDRGDIITVDTRGIDPISPNAIIKRVIGLPGETVAIHDNHVYINGEVLPETYLGADVSTLPRGLGERTVILGADEYWVMGDNRENSKDSRDLGPISASHILGNVLLRVYPFDRIGKP